MERYLGNLAALQLMVWHSTGQRLHLNHQMIGTVGDPPLSRPVLLTLQLSTPPLQKTPPE